MKSLIQYIKSAGATTPPSLSEVEELALRYPWCSTLRLLRDHLSGKRDDLSQLFSEGHTPGSLSRRHIDVEQLAAETEGEIIERFLRQSDLRIVADESQEDEGVQTEALLDEEDDLVSEELAEVYILQGLKAQGVEIYRKLSLLNPEKSVYFAEKIEQIEKNK